MKTNQLTSQEFIENCDIQSILSCSDNEYLPALNDVAIYAAFPDPDLDIKDYIKVDSIAKTWDFINGLRIVVQSNFDFSNVDYETIEDPRERQLAKFVFKENDPAKLLVQFDRVLYYSFFKSKLSGYCIEDDKAMKKFMQLIQRINAILP